jgi:hypothetical protein
VCESCGAAVFGGRVPGGGGAGPKEGMFDAAAGRGLLHRSDAPLRCSLSPLAARAAVSGVRLFPLFHPHLDPF